MTKTLIRVIEGALQELTENFYECMSMPTPMKWKTIDTVYLLKKTIDLRQWIDTAVCRQRKELHRCLKLAVT